MPPHLRRFALTVHVTASVGWLGAALAFLSLTATALVRQDAQMARAVYLAAEPIVEFAIVPLALASLVTGLVQSLGTPWGLFRHYWVLFKLLLTAGATVVLLLYAPTVSHFAGVAAGTDSVTFMGLQSYLLHSGGGLLILLVVTALSVYKPSGMTPYGQRNSRPG